MIELPFWKKEEFWSSILGLLVIVVSSVNPDLRPHLEIIAPSVVAIVLLLIGGAKVERVQALRVQAARYQSEAVKKYTTLSDSIS